MNCELIEQRDVCSNTNPPRGGFRLRCLIDRLGPKQGSQRDGCCLSQGIKPSQRHSPAMHQKRWEISPVRPPPPHHCARDGDCIDTTNDANHSHPSIDSGICKRHRWRSTCHPRFSHGSEQPPGDDHCAQIRRMRHDDPCRRRQHLERVASVPWMWREAILINALQRRSFEADLRHANRHSIKQDISAIGIGH